MSKLFIFPYKAASKSAIKLSESLDCYRINRNGHSTFTYAPDKVVINWGYGDRLPPEVARCRVLNKPEAVCKAVDKITSFQHFIDNRVNCPEFTTDYTTAKQWIQRGYNVYVRQQSSGSDGSGVIYHPFTSTNELEHGSLYTKALPISDEFRLHVVGDEVVSYQRKVRQSNVQTHNPYIRTTGGGWGFEVVEDERNIPSNIDDECILAVKSLGLDFGGVDVVASNRRAYVLEVNTAPHLTPYSSQKLATALKEYIDN